jgi:hypothetical protein
MRDNDFLMLERRDKDELSQNALSMFGGLGNCHCIFTHIKFFEDKLAREIASSQIKSIHQNCPSFAAWIRLWPEYICNRAMAFLSRSEKCVKRLTDYYFTEMAKKIIEIVKSRQDINKVPEARLNNMIKALKLTIELRNTIQHGGLPRVLRNIPKFKDIDLREVAKMANPLNYQETKKIFLDADDLVGLLQKYAVVFRKNGYIRVKDSEK